MRPYLFIPDLLHVIPVRHNPVLDRVLQRQHPALALSLVPDVTVLLVHPDLGSSSSLIEEALRVSDIQKKKY